MNLHIRDSRLTHVASSGDLRMVEQFLKVRPNGYQFTPAFKRKRWNPDTETYYRAWDGYINFLKGEYFLAGLTEAVSDHARGLGQRVTVDDDRGDIPEFTLRNLRGLERYDHQARAVPAIVNNTFGGLPWPRGVVKIGTGGGKSPLIADLAGGYRNENALVLLHRKELLNQIADDTGQLLGERVGKIGNGQVNLQRITVGMVQTLMSRVDELRPWLENVNVLIIDECHRLGSDTHQMLAMHVPAFVRVGFSATPFKNANEVQNLQVKGLTGSKVLFDMDAAALVEAGIVTPVVIQVHPIRSPDKCCTTKGLLRSEELDWKLAYQHMIVENYERNAKIVELARAQSEPTLIIVQRLEHGRTLAAAIGCPFMHGEEPTDVRQDALDSLGSGRIKCLVATTIFDEGVNVPSIGCLILAAGGKSEIQFMQRIGRGMRLSDGKDFLLVHDFFDENNKHTRNHSIERIETAKAAKFTVKLAA